MTELSLQERLDKITNDCLDMLEKEVEKEKQNPNSDHIAAVIRTGEALKILAEGLAEYKKSMLKANVLDTIGRFEFFAQA
jgi:hypothetical protein